MDNNYINILGIMSGTSLDGIDFCLTRWCILDNTFTILETHCYAYSNEWREELAAAPYFSGEKLTELNTRYGRYLGEVCFDFIEKSSHPVHLIGSHGHTVFHQPQKAFTLQIGNGPELHVATGIPVVCDFRSQDIALGGQGAPLVPIGDALLFDSYDACLNLGGFANISYRENKKNIAFDICAVNMPLNYLVQELGKPFDENGNIARSGNPLKELINAWNKLDFYAQSAPKSLGWEWCNTHFLSAFPKLLKKYKAEDLLCSYCIHSAMQIASVLNQTKMKNVLVTGGGAYNSFLLELIRNNTNTMLVKPKDTLIDYKEALIFGFLALRRITNNPNVLADVTGAKQDHCSGVLYGKSPIV